MLPTTPTPADAAPTPTPPSPLTLQDFEIFESLISSGGSLWDIAANHGMTMPQLYARITTPDFEAAFAAYHRVMQLAFACLTLQARTAAVNALITVTNTTQDPIERRRAATQLLRADNAPRTTRATTRATDRATDHRSGWSVSPPSPASPPPPSDRVEPNSQTHTHPAPSPDFSTTRPPSDSPENLTPPNSCPDFPNNHKPPPHRKSSVRRPSQPILPEPHTVS